MRFSYLSSSSRGSTVKTHILYSKAETLDIYRFYILDEPEYEEFEKLQVQRQRMKQQTVVVLMMVSQQIYNDKESY